MSEYQRAYQLLYRKRNKERLAKQAAERRVRDGMKPSPSTMGRWGWSAEDVVRIRSSEPSPPFDLPRLTPAEAKAKLLALEGRQAINLREEPLKTSDGRPRLLSKTSARLFASRIVKLANAAGCEEGDCLLEKARDASFVKHAIAAYPRTFEQYLTALLSLLKYHPEYNRGMDAAVSRVREALDQGRKAAMRRAVEATATKEVVSWPGVLEGVKRFREEGLHEKHADEYTLIRLLTDHPGFRGNDLGGVCLAWDREDGERNHARYYVPATGELVIKQFKTSHIYEPYDVLVAEDLRAHIKAHLVPGQARLFNPIAVAPMVKQALARVGIGATAHDLRRSSETHLCRGSASAATLAHVSKQFKHSAATATIYVHDRIAEM